MKNMENVYIFSQIFDMQGFVYCTRKLIREKCTLKPVIGRRILEEGVLPVVGVFDVFR